MKKNNKSRSRILLLAGFAVLLLVIFLVLDKEKTSSDTDETPGGASSATGETGESGDGEKEEDAVQVLSLDDIVAVEYNGDSGEMRFEKDGNIWYASADAEAPMNQSMIEGMISGWSELAASRTLEDPDPLKDYGLAEPQYTITLTDSTGKKAVLLIGNGAGSDYYAYVEGETPVYIVASTVLDYMGYGFDEFVDASNDFPGVSANNLTKVVITTGDDTTTYTEEEDLTAIAGGLGVFSAENFTSYNATEKELEKAGLDEEHRTRVKFTYTEDTAEKTYCIYIGKYDEENDLYYVQLQDSSFIYTQSGEVVKNILHAEEEEEPEDSAEKTEK